MKWTEFIESRAVYEQIWQNLKADYAEGNVQKFLKGSSLEVFYTEGQMSFSVSDPVSVAIHNPNFFIENSFSVPLVDLAMEYKVIKDKNSDEAKNVMNRLRFMKTDNLQVVEHRVEIIFPTVDMDIIQELKKSRWTDQSLVYMTRASIRVPLKREL